MAWESVEFCCCIQHGVDIFKDVGVGRKGELERKMGGEKYNEKRDGGKKKSEKAEREREGGRVTVTV